VVTDISLPENFNAESNFGMVGSDSVLKTFSHSSLEFLGNSDVRDLRFIARFSIISNFQLELLCDLAAKFGVKIEHSKLYNLIKYYGIRENEFERILKLVLDMFTKELNQVDTGIHWFKKPFDGHTWLPVAVNKEILEKAYLEKTEHLCTFETLKPVQVDFKNMSVLQNGRKMFNLKRCDKNGTYSYIDL